jgi:DNA-binding transcriptional ArsR family regulator
MPIEPSDVRYQVGTRVPPSQAKTLIEYRETLRRKFGRVPSMAEMAKAESAKAMKLAPPGNTARTDRTPEEQARADAQSRRAKAKTARTLALILSHLTMPMTAQQLSRLVNLSPQSIGAHLRAVLDRGEVARAEYGRKKGAIWIKAE